MKRKSTSLRTKFVLIFTVLTLASNLTVLGLISWQTLHTSYLQMRDMLSLSFEQTHSYLQSIVHGASLCSEALYHNASVQSVINESAKPMDPGDEYRAYLTLASALSAIEMNDECDVHLYLPQAFRYAGTGARLRSFADPSLSAALAGLTHGSERAVWLPPREVDGQPVAALFRQILDRSDFTLSAAYEEVTLPVRALEEVLGRSLSAEGSFAYIYNAGGELIACRGEQGLVAELTTRLSQTDEQSELQLNGDKYLLQKRTISNSDWILTLGCPLSALLTQSNSVGTTTWLVLLPVLAVSTLVVLHFSRWLLKRIERLSARVRFARENGLAEPLNEPEPPDELGQLQSEFSFMLSEIKRLMEKQRQDGEKLRAAELRALQAQINPHFLYNTLDLIRWEALESDAVEISEIVTALADYYRAALSNGSDINTLQGEAEHAANYVKIQNLRFDGRITYIVEIPQRLRERRIPRLTLQPLVENAVLHGLSPTDLNSRIHIRVTAGEEGDRLWVRVEDDGQGMTEAQLSRVLEADRTVGKPAHYAVSNVHRRIQLFYGEAYGLRYQSAEGRGTTVSIELPTKP